MCPNRQTQDVKCLLCEGRGYVTDKVCLGCGRPSYYVKEKIFYCGRDKCHDSIVALNKRIEAKKTWTPIDNSGTGWTGVHMNQPWQKHTDEPADIYFERMKDFC